VWLEKWTGVAGTSQLIAAWDTSPNLPKDPDGGDIDVFQDTGSSPTGGVAGWIQI
jgi:hypothetical protein